MSHPLLYAILFCAVLLGLGLLLRIKLRLLQILYIPSAAIAGVLGFAAVQSGLHVEAIAETTRTVSKELAGWPSWLIAVVLAGLLLERSSDKGFTEALRRGVRSGILAWIIILGQIAIGLLVYLTVVRPVNGDVPASFGQLLEVSWAGGHGSSAAMGEVYKAQGFAAGRDVAFFMATVGLIYGVLSGLVLVNIAIRRGWTAKAAAAGSAVAGAALDLSGEPRPVAFGRTRGEVIEPMTVQVVILALAFAAGYAMQQGFITAAIRILGAESDTARALGNIPLFLFTLIGGWLVRVILEQVGAGKLIDGASIQRLVGVAMEFLIVAAISTMRIESLAGYWLPMALLIVLAAAWCTFCLIVLARRLLPPKYWFELGLLNYGFSTANTPQGMMLLRIVDPDLSTGAAEDYAVAAPLSAPFVGGGVVTIAVMPYLLTKVSAGVMAAILAACIAVLYGIGRQVAKR